MYGTYIPNQQFNLIRISVLHNIKKCLKKIEQIKDVTKIITMKKSYYLICKNYCPIHNQVTYFFISIINLSIIQYPYTFFQFVFTVLKIPFSDKSRL